MSKISNILNSFIKIFYLIRRLVQKIGRGVLARDIYGISVDTLRNAMIRHKALDHLKNVRIFFPADIELIFKYVGEPQFFDSVDEIDRIEKEKKKKKSDYFIDD